MEEMRNMERVRFAESVHHKQNLRQQIDPRTIQNLQISQHPSQNYKKAYQSIYLDEVEKTIEDQNLKKLKKKVQEEHAKIMYKEHINLGTVSHHEGQRYSEFGYDNISETLGKGYQTQQKTPNTQTEEYYQKLLEGQKNRGFMDYAENKDKKIRDLVDKNFDGGQSFYKNHQMYVQNRTLQKYSLQNILKDQIQWKNYSKKLQRQRVNSQNQTFQQHTYLQKLMDSEKKSMDTLNKQDFRAKILSQIQEEKIKKSRKSKFQYQNIARHNPITNPIQYHIDNPYLLKSIQDKNIR